MRNGLYRALQRLSLFVVVTAMCVISAASQDAKPAPNAANTPAGASIPSTTSDLNIATKAPLTPPPGRMRGLTNRMRWQAAKRTADRKSHARTRATSQANHGGVKQ